MREMTSGELRSLSAGADQIGCFFAGAIFGAALATGNIFAAAGSGLYLANNCFN
jgi:uncharacterized membrane protein